MSDDPCNLSELPQDETNIPIETSPQERAGATDANVSAIDVANVDAEHNGKVIHRKQAPSPIGSSRAGWHPDSYGRHICKELPKKTLSVNNIPLELRERSQWVVWKFKSRRGENSLPGQQTKVPFRADTGGAASSTNPQTWCSFEEAYQAFQTGSWDGIGYVFSQDDPYIGIDLDDCRSPETGDLTSDAINWIKCFATYAEVSPSETGIKIFLRGTLPNDMKGRRNAALGIECYDRGRYFTVTGQKLDEAPSTCTEASGALDGFLTKYFANASLPSAPLLTRSLNQHDNHILDDDHILEMARGATNGGKFDALWNNAYQTYYPGRSSSEADMALASILLFWTGGDVVRTASMMLRSQLRREKWDSPRGEGTYLSYTIAKARAGLRAVYCPQPKANFENFESRCSRRVRIDVKVEQTEPYLLNTTNSQNSQNSELASYDTDWPDPIPFGPENLPSFPTWCLPPVLCQFAEKVAANVGTATDLPGVQLVAAIAAAVQKRVVIVGKQGHVEPLTLWCIGIARPGARKSAIIQLVRRPFNLFEASENERNTPAVERFESEQRVARARLTKAENAAAKGDPSLDILAELDTARRNIDELKPVRLVRYLVEDATPEVLAILLAENGGRAAIIDSEGAVFGHMTGRYTDRPALEIYLKAHAGENHIVDRAGGGGTARRSITVFRAALTIGCAIQPEVLLDLRKKRECAGRGALARFLFSFSEETDAANEYETPDLPPHILNHYQKLIDELLSLTPSEHIGDDGQPQPHELTLSTDARTLFAEFYREAQITRRNESNGLFAEWLGKLHGATLRLAGVLHMAKFGKAGIQNEVDRETMASAIEISRYFLAHSRVALGHIRDDEATEGALRIIGWVRRNRVKVSAELEANAGISVRDLRQQLRSTFDNQDGIHASLNLLTSRGYAREVTRPMREGRGRKPVGNLWQFHPMLWQTETAKIQTKDDEGEGDSPWEIMV